MLARFGSVFDEYPFPPQVGLIGPGHAMVRLNLVSGRKEVTEGSQGRFCGGQNHLARHIPHRSPLMVSKQEEGTTVIGGKHSWGLRWCRVKLGVWVPRTATYIIVIVHSVASDSATPWTAAHQVSLSFLPPGACLNSCPLSWWCHPSISSSAVPFSSCFQFFPASGSFSMNWLFTSGGQSIGASASDKYSQFISFRIDWLDLILYILSSNISRSYSLFIRILTLT